MSQRTITSFFGAKSQTNGSCKETPCSVEDSPIRVKSGHKRARIVSSSDESEVDGKSSIKIKDRKLSYASKLAKFSAKKTVEKTKQETKKDELEKKETLIENSAKKLPVNNESAAETVDDQLMSKEEEEEIEIDKDKISPLTSPIKTKKSPSPILQENVEQCADSKCVEKKTISLSNSGKDLKEENYNPAKSHYHPINDACWKHQECVPYLAFARTLEEIENVSARLKMIEILSNFLRSVIVLSPDNLLSCLYLCLNKLSPAHEGLELGLAEATLIRAIAQSTGRTVTQIKNEVQETGDIGIVAERSRSSQRLMFKPAPLTVNSVYKKLKEIAGMSGQSAVNKKISIIQSMFVACKGSEARFLIRSLNGKLRIGLAEQSALQAVALACTTTPPGQKYPPVILNASKSMSADVFKTKLDEASLILKTTFCECPNYDLIVPVLLEHGLSSLPDRCKITPGLPMKPMLAHPTKGVQEVLTRFDGLEFTCEWKYDGERAQIHCNENGEVRIFSRNQEDNTTKYPDIISRIGETRKQGVTSFILDCEAVAWDTENHRILPFQILSTRKRKDANESDIKVQVCVHMFDLLFLNGRSLVKETFFDRRQLLHDNFTRVDDHWMFAESMDCRTMEEVQEFLEVSIKGNCEGLMVKTLKEEATYEIAKRSRNWLKLKKDYLDGVGDTLDLIVMGGYLGKGKRTGTYGGFLVGCYDEQNEEYQTLCKLGTGFSDEVLQLHTEYFKPHKIDHAPAYYQYDSSLEPDHWFEPVQVWEVKCADLSLSPVHRAAVGLVDPVKGISLRFPRYLRIRDDKKAEDVTNSQQIADMYNNQEQIKNQTQGKFNEEDFY